MKLGLPIIALLMMLQASCKGDRPATSNNLSATESSSQYAPVTQIMLKSSLKRLIQGTTIASSGFSDGVNTYTVGSISVGDIIDANGGLRFTATLDLSVDAAKSRYIALGASAGGNVAFRGRAVITFFLGYSGQQISLNFESIQWPGDIVASPRVWTNARLFKRKIRQKAYEAALEAIPAGKAKIKQTVRDKIIQGIAAELPKYRKYFAEVAKVMSDMPDARPSLFSRRGVAYFQHSLPRSRQLPVVMPPTAPSNAETGINVNEHMFDYLLTKNLVGRTINTKQLGIEICKSFSSFYYKICESKPSSQPYELSLKFDSNRPVKFEFENNELNLSLYLQVNGAANNDTVPYLKELGSKLISNEKPAAEPKDGGVENSKVTVPKLSLNTPPMKITFKYKRGVRQFSRTGISVEVVSEKSDSIIQKLLHPVIEETVKAQLAAVVPPFILAPLAPSYALANASVRQFGGSLAVTDRNHFGAQSGWLNVYFNYCSKQNTQTSLGINLRQVPSSDGKRDFLRVTNVVTGSPASKTFPVADAKAKIIHEGKEIEIDYAPSAGLKVGDIIYYVDAQSEYTTRADLFSSYLASRSLVPGREVVKLKIGRKLKLEQEGVADKAQETFIYVDYQVKLRPACKAAK